MTEKQKQGAKQAAKEFYQAGRITLKTAIWAMKNAGYSREETVEWLELAKQPIDPEKLEMNMPGNSERSEYRD
jgi:hypothetical protein